MSSPATLTTFGPVPATVLFPKLQQAPQGARYCEEVHAYVPASYQYRIRGIQVEGPRHCPKKSLVARLFSKPTAKADNESDADNLVLAMGLTHGKMYLVPLEVAQHDNKIRYHGLDDIDTTANDEAAAVEKKYGGDLLPLWEAQTRADVRYRGKNPLRIEQLTSAAVELDGGKPIRKELPREYKNFACEHGSKIIVPPLELIDGRFAA